MNKTDWLDYISYLNDDLNKEKAKKKSNNREEFISAFNVMNITDDLSHSKLKFKRL